MRIVGSHSPSLPPLDPPPFPSENSWALQVEIEEAAHLHSKHRDHIRICSDYGKVRSWGSSKWADCGSRDTSHKSRDADIKGNSKTGRSPDSPSHNTMGTRSPYATEICHDSRSQARCIRSNTKRRAHSPKQGNCSANSNSRSVDLREVGRTDEKISPHQSHRFHRHQSRASLNETRVSEMANRSRHTSSGSAENAHSRQSHRARHGMQAARFSDDTDYTSHLRNQDARISENKDEASHGSHRRNQHSARYTKPSQPAHVNRNGYPKWHRHQDFRRIERNVCGEAENESSRDFDELKLESYSDYCERSKDECCTQAERNGDLGIDASEVSFSPGEIKICLASKLGDEGGTQQGFNEGTGDEEPDTTSLPVGEGLSYTLTEGQTDNVQINSSGSNIMLETSKDDAEAKEDNCSDIEKEYRMLASLLLDDSLDLGQDFDVMPIPGGPAVEYCGSIFDDDFELPVSMDVEVAAPTNDSVSIKIEETVQTSQPDELQEPHLCVMRGLFQDGEIILKHQSVSSNKFEEKHAAFANTRFQPVEKQQTSLNSSKKNPSPRVFVDVTNKFEIHTAPVKRETQENDSHRLSQRQRQVEFGKNTLGYERYSELVPRCKRKPHDPQTPNPKQICSKRSWDGQIRKWRRLLHAYDLPTQDGEESAEDFSICKSRHCHAADPMQNNTRFSESIENKGCNVSEAKKIEEDANLTIYEDWIMS